MKNTTRLLLAILAMSATTTTQLNAQAIFSGFDFNHVPLTDASFGPNATSVDADARSDGGAAYIIANCGALKGLDLTIPNSSGMFNLGSLGMDFSFRKTESRSDFFVRGGTSFYQLGGELLVNYRTTNGAAGYIDYGPFSTGYYPPTDGAYHLYSFVYIQTSGIATVKVDGATVWTNDGPNGRPLYWTGAPTDITMGTVMDGNCPGTGTLNYAYFFNPDLPLSAEFLSMEARQDKRNVDLKWETTSEGNSLQFSIERSANGVNFLPLDTLPTKEDPIFHYTDVEPGPGQWFYRIRQLDLAGEETFSKIESVILEADDYQDFIIWPNPSNGIISMSLPGHVSDAQISVTDLQGKTILTQSDVQPGKTLDLSNFPRGLYSIQCQASGKRHNQIVMLQ